MSILVFLRSYPGLKSYHSANIPNKTSVLFFLEFSVVVLSHKHLLIQNSLISMLFKTFIYNDPIALIILTFSLW